MTETIGGWSSRTNTPGFETRREGRDHDKEPEPRPVYRRCACRDTTGKQLGARCPELASNRRHGRWAFAVDLPTLDGERKTMRRCGFPTKAWAHAGLHRVLACERAGVHVDDRKTVADYLNTWLEIKQRSLKPTTLARYRDYIHKDLSPALGPIRLEELTHHHIASFASNQLATGRGTVTVDRPRRAGLVRALHLVQHQQHDAGVHSNLSRRRAAGHQTP